MPGAKVRVASGSVSAQTMSDRVATFANGSTQAKKTMTSMRQ